MDVRIPKELRQFISQGRKDVRIAEETALIEQERGREMESLCMRLLGAVVMYSAVTIPKTAEMIFSFVSDEELKEDLENLGRAISEPYI